MKRHEAIAKIYRFGPRCVDDWGNLEQIADQLRKDARLEPPVVEDKDKAMVEYLRAAVGKGDVLSFPVNDVSSIADAAPPVASVEDGTVAVARAPINFAVVRILDLDPLRSKLVQPPALRRTGFAHTAAVQRYLRANSWGGVDRYPTHAKDIDRVGVSPTHLCPRAPIVKSVPEDRSDNVYPARGGLAGHGPRRSLGDGLRKPLCRVHIPISVGTGSNRPAPSQGSGLG